MAQQSQAGENLDAVKQQVVTLLRSSKEAKLADEIQSALELPLDKVLMCFLHATRHASARHQEVQQATWHRPLLPAVRRIVMCSDSPALSLQNLHQHSPQMHLQVREAIQALLNDGTMQLRKAADSDVMRFGLSTDAEVAEGNKCAACTSLTVQSVPVATHKAAAS